ncbi:MAG: hypothetical protein KH040_02485 [Collinsella sp.]|nr:hypothetical protein [Collinsella sp.]
MYTAQIARAWAIERKKLELEIKRNRILEFLIIALLFGVVAGVICTLVLTLIDIPIANCVLIEIGLLILFLMLALLIALAILLNNYDRAVELAHNNETQGRQLALFLDSHFHITKRRQLELLLQDAENKLRNRASKPSYLPLYTTILVSVCLTPFVQALQETIQPENTVQLFVIVFSIGLLACIVLHLITSIRDTLFPNLPYGTGDLQILSSDLRVLLLISASEEKPGEE